MAERRWNGRDWIGFEHEHRLLLKYAMMYKNEVSVFDDNAPLELMNQIVVSSSWTAMSELKSRLIDFHGFDIMFLGDATAHIFHPDPLLLWEGHIN